MYTKKMTYTDYNGEEITEKTIIMDEKGFDATTITADDVSTYGI